MKWAPASAIDHDNLLPGQAGATGFVGVVGFDVEGGVSFWMLSMSLSHIDDTVHPPCEVVALKYRLGHMLAHLLRLVMTVSWLCKDVDE